MIRAITPRITMNELPVVESSMRSERLIMIKANVHTFLHKRVISLEYLLEIQIQRSGTNEAKIRIFSSSETP
jgi:hypothetical protein